MAQFWGMKASILVLFLLLGGSFQSFTIEYDASYGCFINAFYHVGKVTFYSYFLSVSIMKRCWMLSNAFSVITQIIFFLTFVLLMWLIDFLMLNHSCIPEINPMWSWYIILLISCWLWFASVLLRTFASIRDIACSFLSCLYLPLVSV